MRLKKSGGLGDEHSAGTISRCSDRNQEKATSAFNGRRTQAASATSTPREQSPPADNVGLRFFSNAFASAHLTS
jgi:hypothetical protein